MKNYYSMTEKQTIDDLSTSQTDGLSQDNIHQRTTQYGLNTLLKKKAHGLPYKIAAQFKDFLIIILIAAAVISILAGEIADGVIIAAIVLINGMLGFIQEYRADKALDTLKKMASPFASVLRDGIIEQIKSEVLVPGDIVILVTGSSVPADLRLIETINLQIQESALTGESTPVEKDSSIKFIEQTGVADRKNCAFMGTLVTYGRGTGVVTGTGMNTEIGSIAGMLSEAPDEQTPLQKKLASLGKLLGILCLAICIIIAIMGIIRGEDLFEVFMTAVSLAVAAIPEGLPAVVTVILALGMQQMVKKNAIIKRLGAVETLGGTTVICSDKTGTLTRNEMTVTKIYTNNSSITVTGKGYEPEGYFIRDDQPETPYTSSTLEKLILAGVLCNDADYNPEEKSITGDPTEGCLTVLGYKYGIPRNAAAKRHPRIAELPFDSVRKLMSTLHCSDEISEMYTKGAPDMLLPRCTHIEIDGKVKPLTDSGRKQLSEVHEKLSAEALRVLGIAYTTPDITKKTISPDDEQELILLGFTGAIDPPREEAKKAIGICRKAGIRIIMITGDHKTTASAIGRKLGIITSDEMALSGIELDQLDDKALLQKIPTIGIFARVSPSHKVRIISALRQHGKITAMTGDGVNDAPALKQADIGIAMGITGTDAAKEAADMILTDDNFSSIVSAVEQGRIIYSNIRKFVGFLLSCNIGEIILIFFSMLAGWPIPLLPIQLLWVNVMTDSFPAFALGLEKGDAHIMFEQPRNPSSPIIDKKMALSITIQSIALAASCLIAFQTALTRSGSVDTARTVCFTVLIIGELLRAYSARSEIRGVLRIGVFGNKFLNISTVIGIALLICMLFIPGIRDVFKLAQLSMNYILISAAFGIIPLISGEFAKLFNRTEIDAQN
ncbi:MAG: cation-translocating P-type ATPase [Bacteroidetes bacterium]|nr:cation-translocating P-type ATPase [Bacteroidota bacterium]